MFELSVNLPHGRLFVRKQLCRNFTDILAHAQSVNARPFSRGGSGLETRLYLILLQHERLFNTTNTAEEQVHHL